MTMLRRQLVRTGLLAVGGLSLAACSSGRSAARTSASTPVPDQQGWYMPPEGAPHAKTWMAFGASAAIWGPKLVPIVRKNLATIATTIARFEPVSMLVRRDEMDIARALVGPTVDLVVAPLDDLWIRDTGPVFVTGEGTRRAVDLNFNGWGGKQEHRRDARIAPFVASYAGAELVTTELVMEGGAIEVDGEGTALITESSVLNGNRNPGKSKSDVEQELSRLLGIKKIIWLPGVAGKDITDGHTDFYARFAKPGTIVAGFEPDPTSFDHPVTTRHLEILKNSTDARGRRLDIVQLAGPSVLRVEHPSDDFAAGYVNFYVCNGAVIAPQFGDPDSDKAASEKLQGLFPDRTVVQIDIDGIAAGGGGIHCTTQQEPAQ